MFCLWSTAAISSAQVLQFGEVLLGMKASIMTGTAPGPGVAEVLQVGPECSFHAGNVVYVTIAVFLTSGESLGMYDPIRI